MSMLPDVLYPDECELAYEDKFFKQLHDLNEVEYVQPKRHRFNICIDSNAIVRGKNYSYPLKFDPLYSNTEV